MHTPFPFILSHTRQGLFIVNHLDRAHITLNGTTHAYGVGADLLSKGEYEPQLHQLVLQLMHHLLQRQGALKLLDLGSHIGAHCIGWAKQFPQARILAVDAQPYHIMALGGSALLNGCFNIQPICAFLSDIDAAPSLHKMPNPCKAASFGSFQMQGTQTDLGQAPDDFTAQWVPQMRLDTLIKHYSFEPHFIKIDVEGFEVALLSQIKDYLIQKKPFLIIEHIKSDKNQLLELLGSINYQAVDDGMNFIALPSHDLVWQHFKFIKG